MFENGKNDISIVLICRRSPVPRSQTVSGRHASAAGGLCAFLPRTESSVGLLPLFGSTTYRLLWSGSGVRSFLWQISTMSAIFVISDGGATFIFANKNMSFEPKTHEEGFGVLRATRNTL